MNNVHNNLRVQTTFAGSASFIVNGNKILQEKTISIVCKFKNSDKNPLRSCNVSPALGITNAYHMHDC